MRKVLHTIIGPLNYPQSGFKEYGSTKTCTFTMVKETIQ